ncbi:hypothetical protein [Enterococcus cecorum]|uniref:hypothetical protein n=1 Tax=Enterococcus cecorum TaxID=44008 RepID=UPI000A8646C0|nr:hypothetical protein [Enterococcus cecorum]CAI3349027.1 hypothetical protein CIRMBP1309_00418 [Enterococcus cecorum]
MPTAEYYQAIELLNSKHEDNWVIAMEMCSEEEKKFINESIQEMQDIQLVREFLEDMEGKYELIEVEE